jgi:aldehyde dehydrogenase (NAD+)
LGKPATEAYTTEVGFLYSEIRHLKRHLKGWSRSRRVNMPWYTWPAGAKVHSAPYGVSLVIAPWNYPFQLAMAPLVASVAAGNTVILKPSEMAPASAKVLELMISEYFTADFLKVVGGGAETSQGLIGAKPDHVFYTGSTRVGKIIMKQAAENLTPVVLELGGKSPCLVLEDADLRVAARRIVWGKFMNCGQTCVAPDYVLVDSSVKAALIEELVKAIGALYAPGAGNSVEIMTGVRQSPDYGRIINEHHFNRLKTYLDCGPILFGGEHELAERYFCPTLIDNPSLASSLMQDEIFGPILPIIPFDDLDELLISLDRKPAPLAYYLFTSNRKTARHIISMARFGGGCVNDTILHLANPHLPFGGVGESGMGKYHGKAGFEAFTHQVSVVHNTTLIDPSLRYPPYGKRLNLFRRILR